MKKTLLKLSLAPFIAALAAQPVFAAEPIVPVGGTFTYTQNFDTMYMGTAAGNQAAAPPWADGVTVPNWWFHYTGNAAATPTGVFAGAAFAYNACDGSIAASLSLVSQGDANNPDRALASPSTTGRAEQSGIVIFQNTGTKSVELTRVQFNGEVLRTNSAANASETVTPYFRVADSQAEALTMTTVNMTAAEALAAFPNDTTPTAGFFLTGWTAIPAATFIYSNAGAGIPVNESIPVDATGLTNIRVAPGKFMAVRFSNINGSGSDALLGIDDLQLTFTEVDAAIAAAVTNVVRNNNGTATNPNDDTMEFTLTVSGSGSVGAGWAVNSPPSLVATGTYGAPKNYTGVPITEFATAPHTLTATVEDVSNATVTDLFTVTAPWCALTASASTFAYDEAGTPDVSSDDTVTFLAAATGTFTGATYDVDTTPTQNVAYGSAASVSAGPGIAQTLNFTDSADANCTAQLIVNTPSIIAVNNLSGAPVNIKSLPALGNRAWTFDGTGRTATQNAATQVDHVVNSEVVDLSAIGGVLVSAHLQATPQGGGSTSGFEAADSFAMQVIIDGGTPVSILGAADADGSGRLEGNAAVGTELPGATAPDTDIREFDFSYVVPPGANSVQVRFIGNSNSPGETLVVSNISLGIAPPTLQASVAPGILNNKGTDTPADDIIEAPVSVIPINLGASTGWTSDLVAPDAPAGGLYSAANPVTFSVAAASAPKTVNLTDTLDITKTASVVITAPARTFTAALAAAPNIVRHDNGPGLADDTVSFDLTVSGTNGGPRFALGTEPGTATAGSYTINAAATTVPVTLSAAPALAGTVYLRVWDASYPASAANIAVAVPAAPVAPTQYVIGKQNLGGGLTDVLSLAGDPLPAQWMNFTSVPALVMHNGATLATVRSEVINLAAEGPVSFSARVRTVDTSSGFEDPDTFTAVLILDGDTVTPVVLTDALDLDDPKDGLEGAELAVAGGTVGAPTITNQTLSYLIPAGVNSVQLEVSTLNNSPNESLTLDNVLFAPGTVTGDTDGDGVSDADETIMGTSATDANDVLRLSQNAGNPNQLDFPTTAGRFYRVYVSNDANEASHLQSWNDSGLATIAGDGNPASFSITVAAGEARRFYRLHVMTTDGPWPATAP